MTRIDEAQRLAGELQSGCERFGRDAAKTIGDVLGHCDTLTRAVIGAFREIHYVWQKDGAQ